LAAPISSLIDPVAGTEMLLQNRLIFWAPLKMGLDSVSLSANWMWACKTKVKMLVYKQFKLVLIFAIN
jgi:phosphoribosylformylglycinamidine synthase